MPYVFMILNMLFPSSAWKSSPSCSFFFLIFFSSLLNRVSITIKTPQHFSPFSLCLCNLHYNNCLLIKYLLDFKLLLGRGCVVCNWPSHRAQKPSVSMTLLSLCGAYPQSMCFLSVSTAAPFGYNIYSWTFLLLYGWNSYLGTAIILFGGGAHFLLV